MIPLPPALKVSLLNASKILHKAPDPLKFIIVKDGVANVTDGRFYLRIDMGIPDGYYHVHFDNGVYGLVKTEPKKVYNGVLNTGIDPEIIRPNFETISPLCIIEQPQNFLMDVLSHIVSKALELEDKIAIDKKGIGLKRHGDFYVNFNFNVPDVMYFDATHIHAAFTDAMRHPTIAIYQENGPITNEGPMAPLIIGFGWRNCSIVYPIPDGYRHYYS